MIRVCFRERNAGRIWPIKQLRMFIRRIAIRTPRVTTHLERKRKREQTGYVSSPKYSWWRMSYHRIRLQRWWSHYVPKCAECGPLPQSTCPGARLLWISEPNQPYVSKNKVKVILVRGNACFSKLKKNTYRWGHLLFLVEWILSKAWYLQQREEEMKRRESWTMSFSDQETQKLSNALITSFAIGKCATCSQKAKSWWHFVESVKGFCR